MIEHLSELVPQRAARWPEAVAFGGQEGLGWRTLDGRQVAALVDQLARDLAARGIREGDRVVTWLPNHLRTPLYLFALWQLGAVVIPFDRETNPDAAGRILASVTPRLVLLGYDERPGWTQTAQALAWWEPATAGAGGQGTGSREARAQGAGAKAGGAGMLGEALPWTPLEGALAWTRPKEPLALIAFTSGTTGQPKGCLLSHANLCSQLAVLGDRVPLGPDCRLASILPLAHLFELTCGPLYPFASGATVHFLPSRRGPDILRVLAEQRITHMMAVPQLLTLMGQGLDRQLQAALPAPLLRALDALAPRLPMPARRRLFWPVHRKLGGQLRLLASGGAALPSAVQQRWERLGIRVIQGYGASECSPVIAMGTPDGATPLGSVGRPIRGDAVRFGPEGELLVRGPNVFAGYWQDPERSAEVLQDGWYATGDLATQAAAGNLFLAGRARDLIVLPSGLNVWPQDVEDALRAHPAVADAAVLAVATAGGGAMLHSYLLPSPGVSDVTDLVEILGQVNRRLAQHQRLAGASWYPEADFPRTALGKVRRPLLPAPTAAASVRIERVLAADDPVGQAIAAVARVAAVSGEQTLGTLGLDSLGLVALAEALEEKTGKQVSDGDLGLDLTVAQVRAFLVRAPATEEAGDQQPAGDAGAPMPAWPYTWGRAFRRLSLPLDLLYHLSVTQTVVLGGEHLRALPPRLIVAGTHHSFADVPLLRQGLARTPARRLVRRLIIATGARIFGQAGAPAWLGVLALGLYPLEQYKQREASLRGLAKLAAAGNPILIFPQGHHIRPQAEQAADADAGFHTGVAHLAAALEAAVLPFGQAGTERLMPPFLEEWHGPVIAKVPVCLRRGPLAIAFGPPLRPQPGESPSAFTERLQVACFGLARQAATALEGGVPHGFQSTP